MKYTDLKIGDRIKILSKPKLWSSGLNENNPLCANIKYPFEGTIIKIKDCNDHIAADIGNYGWSLENLNFELIQEYELY